MYTIMTDLIIEIILAKIEDKKGGRGGGERNLMTLGEVYRLSKQKFKKRNENLVLHIYGQRLFFHFT